MLNGHTERCEKPTKLPLYFLLCNLHYLLVTPGSLFCSSAREVGEERAGQALSTLPAPTSVWITGPRGSCWQEVQPPSYSAQGFNNQIHEMQTAA